MLVGVWTCKSQNSLFKMMAVVGKTLVITIQLFVGSGYESHLDHVHSCLSFTNNINGCVGGGNLSSSCASSSFSIGEYSNDHISLWKEYSGNDSDYSNFLNDASIAFKSKLSPSNVYLMKKSELMHNLGDIIKDSFDDILSYPDINNMIDWNESEATRFRKIRYLDGIQTIYNIDRRNKVYQMNQLSLNITNNNEYVQYVTNNLNDFRVKGRKYKLISNDVLVNDEFIDFINFVTLLSVSDKMYNYLWSDDESENENFEFSFEINMHFMRNVVKWNSMKAVSNSPEGMHQDGECMTIIGPIINRFNIDGSENIMYDLNKNELGKMTLMEGQALIFDDRTYWHHVTSMTVKNKTIGYGFRDVVIFGLTFKDEKYNRWSNTFKFNNYY